MFNLSSLFNKLLFNKKPTIQIGGEPPTIIITNVTRTKISGIDEMNTCVVTFQSNQPLLQWEARADGNGHGSGDLVGSGGASTSNTDITFNVENDELVWGDKSYRVNVYGQNLSGAWSNYE